MRIVRLDEINILEKYQTKYDLMDMVPELKKNIETGQIKGYSISQSRGVEKVFKKIKVDMKRDSYIEKTCWGNLKL